MKSYRCFLNFLYTWDLNWEISTYLIFNRVVWGEANKSFHLFSSTLLVFFQTVPNWKGSYMLLFFSTPVESHLQPRIEKRSRERSICILLQVSSLSILETISILAMDNAAKGGMTQFRIFLRWFLARSKISNANVIVIWRPLGLKLKMTTL